MFYQFVLQRNYPAIPTISHRSIAEKGGFPHALTTNNRKQRAWIMNSRASNYMTGDIKFFNDQRNDVRICKEDTFMKIAYRSLTRVEGI